MHTLESISQLSMRSCGTRFRRSSPKIGSITTGADTKQPSLLAGLIFDESERLTPSHAVKKGTRYRYYVSESLIVGTAKDKSTGRRIPAANLETLVITKLRSFLADEGAILDAIRHEYAEVNAQARLIARGTA